jgi:hypothetical protein
MNKFALAAVATAALGAAATSPAYSFCGSEMQGPQLTGIALQSFEANQPVVTAVTLPSGEIIDLRQVDGAFSGH